MPNSKSSSGGELICPRCALAHDLDQTLCSQCGMPLAYTSRTGEEPVTQTHEKAEKVSARYSEGKPMKAGFARNQAEAELIQGMLLEEGIPSFLRRSAGFDVPDFLASGPRDVMVSESALADARQLLSATETEDLQGEADGAPGAVGVRHPTGETRPLILLAWILVGVAAAGLLVWAISTIG